MQLLFQSNYSIRFFNSYFTAGLVANDINCLNKYENDINEQQKKELLLLLKEEYLFTMKKR